MLNAGTATVCGPARPDCEEKISWSCGWTDWRSTPRPYSLCGQTWGVTAPRIGPATMRAMKAQMTMYAARKAYLPALSEFRVPGAWWGLRC